jgi:Glycosyltransferase family 28 C-terminal domain
MSRVGYDLIVVGDLRFPGGTSTSIATEIRAQTAAGYRTGLIHVKAPVLRFPHSFHPDIRALLDAGACDLVDPDLPVAASAALVHHPQVFTNLPVRPLRVATEQVLTIVHHPPFDADGMPFYDVMQIDHHIAETFGVRPRWAPISAIVRSQLQTLAAPPELFAHDWYNLLDPEGWHGPRRGVQGPRPILGRHSRPDPLKWPATRRAVLEVYPDDPAFDVRILGGGAFLTELLGAIPASWRVQPFDAMAPRQFLAGLDFFVYFHHPRWVEGFGRVVLEALASGCVAILPPSFEALFGAAALYAPPSAAPALVKTIYGDPKRFADQSERGYAILRDRFGPERHLERLDLIVGPPAAGRAKAASVLQQTRKRVLFISSNGIGMGHLTRLLAIARRCSPRLQPVFVTMSQAMTTIEEWGYLAEYTPHHSYLGCDDASWNRHLEAEMRERFAFYDPAVILFDGNMPYGGLIEAARERDNAWFVWCRRGLWREGSGQAALAREAAFDAVIEPLDLVSHLDDGPTSIARARTRQVGVIQLLDDHELLDRDTARGQLGLGQNSTAILVQLGSGNNFAVEPLRGYLFSLLEKQPGVEIVAVDSPISEAPTNASPHVVSRQLYPIARYVRAFDFAVSAAGYNSFHELMLSACPTIFVPNEHPMMDDQSLRARYAERHGYAITVRASEPYRLREALDLMLDSTERDAMRSRMRDIAIARDGAREAAGMVEEMAFARRADRELD